MDQAPSRTYLKNVFWPNIFVGASLQILDIQQYASGLKLGPAAILNQNPIFEMGSIYQHNKNALRLSKSNDF
jgi:hypothetical protein